jgi:hypothetical protein
MTGGAPPSASVGHRGKAGLLAGLRWAGTLAGLRRQGEGRRAAAGLGRLGRVVERPAEESGGARADSRAGPENKPGQIGIGVKR